MIMLGRTPLWHYIIYGWPLKLSYQFLYLQNTLHMRKYSSMQLIYVCTKKRTLMETQLIGCANRTKRDYNNIYNTSLKAAEIIPVLSGPLHLTSFIIHNARNRLLLSGK